jgi:ribosomal protein L17
MVTALVTHERIRTTLAKAKELRRHADMVVTWAKRGACGARARAACRRVQRGTWRDVLPAPRASGADAAAHGLTARALSPSPLPSFAGGPQHHTLAHGFLRTPDASTKLFKTLAPRYE